MQQAGHKRARRNAQYEYHNSLRVLKTRVGAYAVEHGLVVLSEAELEGAFVDLKNRMTDAEILADWAESGERAAAERAKASRAKTKFFVGLREPVSEKFRDGLLAMGFRFSTRSARYATIVAAEIPDGLIDLAMANGQAVWTLDENADKAFLYQADVEERAKVINEEGRQTTEAAQPTMFSGRMRNTKTPLRPASCEDEDPDVDIQTSERAS
ncbi:hypothetical protein [Pelagibacterium mangrovi]|uniref:hypothetical protein n=1 Tax=Pelagibacterium mangrovi TaxID=3119828 RepID=UPI002FCC699F